MMYHWVASKESGTHTHVSSAIQSDSSTFYTEPSQHLCFLKITTSITNHNPRLSFTAIEQSTQAVEFGPFYGHVALQEWGGHGKPSVTWVHTFRWNCWNLKELLLRPAICRVFPISRSVLHVPEGPWRRPPEISSGADSCFRTTFSLRLA